MKREPKAVKALIDKHTVQAELQRMGLLRRLFGPVRLRKDSEGGTRKNPS